MGKKVSVALGLKINMGKKHHHDKIKGINQQILHTNKNVIKTFFSFLNVPSRRSGNVRSSTPWIRYIYMIVVGYHSEICLQECL